MLVISWVWLCMLHGSLVKVHHVMLYEKLKETPSLQSETFERIISNLKNRGRGRGIFRLHGINFYIFQPLSVCCIAFFNFFVAFNAI